jgi:hypothetical protein
VERAVQVDVDHAPPVGGRRVEEAGRVVPARTVDEPLDRARVARERRDCVLDRLAVDDVDGVGLRAGTRARELGDGLLRARLVAIEHADDGALLAEPQRDRLRDAARRARHQDVAARESDEARHAGILLTSRARVRRDATSLRDRSRAVRHRVRPSRRARSLGPTADWPEYAGTKGGSHYSPLTQVTRTNVGQLTLAWSHRSGDFSPGSTAHASTAFQVTPLVVNDTLYYCTPYMRVFALDPETGAERWMFDPQLHSKNSGGPYPLTCRGVAYWQEQAAAGRAQRAKPSEGRSGEGLQSTDPLRHARLRADRTRRRHGQAVHRLRCRRPRRTARGHRRQRAGLGVLTRRRRR